MLKIFETSDYGLFSHYAENRPLRKLHLKNLTASIEKENLLPYYPILVSQDMKILDGQHRLEAARALNVPVYYMIKQDAKISDMITCNSNTAKWGVMDWLNYWSGHGNQTALWALDMVKTYGLSPTTMRRMLVRDMRLFHTGKFELSEAMRREIEECWANVVDVIKGVEERYIGNPNKIKWMKTPTSMRALYRVLEHPKVDKEELIEKIILCLPKMQPQPNQYYHIEQYLNAFNYFKKNKIKSLGVAFDEEE